MPEKKTKIGVTIGGKMPGAIKGATRVYKRDEDEAKKAMLYQADGGVVVELYFEKRYDRHMPVLFTNDALIAAAQAAVLPEPKPKPKPKPKAKPAEKAAEKAAGTGSKKKK